MSFEEALAVVIGLANIFLIWYVFGNSVKECVQNKLKELEKDLNNLPENTFAYDVTNLDIALLKLLIVLFEEVKGVFCRSKKRG